MDETLEELDNIVTLTDENGEEATFEMLDVIDYEGAAYMVLLPVDEDSEEVLILQIKETDDPEADSLESVEDEALLDTLFGIFKERFQDEFEFAE